MDPRLPTLALPSLAILGALVVHSARTLPRARAAAFWTSAAVYGVVRGLAVGWVTRAGLQASYPYRIRQPLFEIFGVPLQEVAGWAIVLYLGWWLGCRFSRSRDEREARLFPQVAWACLFLGAVAWAVETTAIAAGWWHWTVPLSGGLLGAVPWIGLVDWFFVGTDFLLPFLALSAPSLRGRPARFLSLLLFPVHFASHLSVAPLSQAVPVPGLHLCHWALLGILLWLAGRSRAVDRPFAGDGAGTDFWLPAAGLALLLLDAALIPVLLLDRPGLAVAALPAAVVALLALRPRWGIGAGVLAAAGGLWSPPLLLAAVPVGAAGVLHWERRHARWGAPVLLGGLVVTAFGVHSAAAHREAELKRRLDRAIAARDGGDLAGAEAELASAAREHPSSHVPLALLGEIDYRTNRLAEAHERYLAAVAIKQDFLEGYRYLAVIDLQRGRRESAAGFARRGLEIEPGDLELRYLERRAGGEPLDGFWEEAAPAGAGRIASLAGLAFEVGDAAGAAEALDRGIARWPESRALYPLRVKLALAQGDEVTARRTAEVWAARFPGDPQARALTGR
jgi:tetratricopeptide (TPR) repeat protein